MTRIKICGITNLDDALCAIRCGADSLGFVFYEKSPRYINPSKAQEIIKQLPPFVQFVGLLVNHSYDSILEIIKLTEITLLQFHGDEDNEFCQSLSFPFIKAIRVRSTVDVLDGEGKFPDARAILLDAYHKDLYGGTGQSFLWDLMPINKLNKPIILAGGLNIENVQKAIHQVKPYAVDVSGGVEESKGVKDHQKIKEFCRVVKDFNLKY
jgi:phosphoribosylanthranilate isomerase